jgi:hypothetical protein
MNEELMELLWCLDETVARQAQVIKEQDNRIKELEAMLEIY